MPAVCDLVLPCKDEGPALRDLLPTVPDVFAVIVVDNGSTDDSLAYLRSRWPQVVALDAGSNLGFSGGNNVGIR
ncbi:MAG: glycosyltransferase, partial [Nocardioidaceae bacterium]